jgi:hypothetical protein
LQLQVVHVENHNGRAEAQGKQQRAQALQAVAARGCAGRAKGGEEREAGGAEGGGDCGRARARAQAKREKRSPA